MFTISSDEVWILLITCYSMINNQVQESSILKVVWVPPEHGDAVACIAADGTLSLWEEIAQGT